MDSPITFTATCSSERHPCLGSCEAAGRPGVAPVFGLGFIGFRIYGLEFRVYVRVWGLESRVWSLGFRAFGFGNSLTPSPPKQKNV